ncbi:MAG TPA: Sec-independent protein translocase protein TatB [Xanthobacteraceae bacterium]
MFDISWSEFLLIGVVALIVIGPKELPAVMRTIGQWTRKVRGMASEFQNQFQEAIREAEMSDLKKEVDDLAQDVKNFDPLKDVRADMESMGEDVKRSLTATTEPPASSESGAETALGETLPEALPAAPEPAAIAAPEPEAAAAPDAQTEPAREMETVVTTDTAKAGDAADAADAAAESGTGRTG